MSDILYPSHTGKDTPVHAMAYPHLRAALVRLLTQRNALARILAGLDPGGRKAWGKKYRDLAPCFSPREALARTIHWIEILDEEIRDRDKARFPEF